MRDVLEYRTIEYYRRRYNIGLYNIRQNGVNMYRLRNLNNILGEYKELMDCIMKCDTQKNKKLTMNFRVK